MRRFCPHSPCGETITLTCRHVSEIAGLIDELLAAGVAFKVVIRP